LSKKYLNIGLIILVVFIYGGLFFRIIRPKQDSIAEIESDLVFERKKENTLDQPEKFNLELNSRDPFLDKMKSSHVKSINKPSKVLKTKSYHPISSSPLIWPEVHYLGFLAVKDDTKTVILRINKVIYRLSKGQEASGLKLQRIFKDSVEISLNNQKRIIK